MPQSTVPARDEKKVEVFGPYEVYERIGVGGMASVHRAKKQGIEGFERVVALKRMLSHLADDESFIKSFVREARLASQLQHANIIQIYDLGRVGRVYYIAMEFVRGHDLRKILKQTAYATGPMPMAMILTITRQLCDALDYAHSLPDESGEPLGIVHRDISPSNLLVAADGHLKIIDFGIAKATSTSLRTLSGRVKGKFAYMPPESVHGNPLDNRSDIFSMGIVAYEMITARPLFASKNQFEIIRKITQDPILPPSRYNSTCPPDLDEIILTALAKTPEERWQTAGAMHRALDHVAKRHGLQASNREIAEWLDWGFRQPLQSKRVVHPSPRAPSALDTSPDIIVEQAEQDNLEEVVWGAASGRGQRISGASPGQEAAARREEGASEDASPARTPMHQGADGSQPYPLIAPGAGPQGPPTTPANAKDAPAARSSSGGQSTMLGVAPPPEPAWKQLRDSDLSRRLAKANAESQRTFATTNASASRARSSKAGHDKTQTVRRMGTPLRRIALLALAGIGAAAGSYFLITYGPAGKQRAGEERASGAPSPASNASRAGIIEVSPADARAPEAERAAVEADAAPPARKRPADGSPLLVSADEVTRTDGKPPRVRRIHAMDADGNPQVVHAALCIDAEGKVTSVELDDAPRAVRRRVYETLEQWRYEPFRLEGEAIAVCFELDTTLRDR